MRAAPFALVVLAGPLLSGFSGGSAGGGGGGGGGGSW